MNSVDMITLFTTMFYVSIGLCAMGFLSAALCFFRFDIPKVYTQLTGRGKDRLVRREEKRSARGDSKKLRNTSGLTSKELYSGAISGGVTPPPVQAPAEPPAAEPQPAAEAAPAATPVPAEDRTELATTLLDQKPRAAAGFVSTNADLAVTKPLNRQPEPPPPPPPADSASVGRFEIFETIFEIHTEERI